MFWNTNDSIPIFFRLQTVLCHGSPCFSMSVFVKTTIRTQITDLLQPTLPGNVCKVISFIFDSLIQCLAADTNWKPQTWCFLGWKKPMIFHWGWVGLEATARVFWSPFKKMGMAKRGVHTVWWKKSPGMVLKPCKSCEKLPTSTGAGRISEPSTVWLWRPFSRGRQQAW